MAKLVLNPMVATLRAKAGSAVFGNCIGQQYVKRLAKPRDKKTAAQLAVRAAMGRCAVLRRSLPVELIAAQDAYVSTISMTGYNWFLANNMNDERTYDMRVLTPLNNNMPEITKFLPIAYANKLLVMTYAVDTDDDDLWCSWYARYIQPASESDKIVLLCNNCRKATSTSRQLSVDSAGLWRCWMVVENIVTGALSVSVYADVVALA